MSQPPVPDADRRLLDALERGVASIDRTDRVRLDVSGPDRARFLHNLTTNEVKRLPAGRGCEAFVTSLQGRTLGYVLLHAEPERILLRTDAGALGPLLPHFAKYGALDEVSWDDRSARTFEAHLVGPKAEELLRRLGADLPPSGDYHHLATSLAGRPVLVVRESPTVDPGLTVIGEAPDAAAVGSAIDEAGRELGLVAMTPEQFEALRIEAGTPAAGRDVTEANLPQEVGRDDRAINFVKGCYLGQETVARLDALGHVNRLLKGLRIDAPGPPPVGSALVVEGKEVGRLTSSARSVRDGRPLGLAYLRVAAAAAGTALTCEAAGGSATALVADFPLRPA